MSTIRCGKCKSIHSSIEDVKVCYAGHPSVDSAKRPSLAARIDHADHDELLPCERNAIATGRVPAANLAAPMATKKQLDFIGKLRSERNLGDTAVGILTKQEASMAIQLLLDMPVPQVAANVTTSLALNEVPKGYYAIDMDDTVKFYRVDCPTTGKWAGRTFVSVQASDDFHSIKAPAARAAILSAIAEQGIATSTARYGVLIGRCGVCNRTLTDETSRALGIGPVCRNR